MPEYTWDMKGYASKYGFYTSENLHTNSSLISQLKRDRNFILFVRKIADLKK